MIFLVATEIFNSVYEAAQGPYHDVYYSAIRFQGNADLIRNKVSLLFPYRVLNLFLLSMIYSLRL
jgi:hypothetical protein